MQGDYRSLRLSLETSERIRLKQKEMLSLHEQKKDTFPPQRSAEKKAKTRDILPDDDDDDDESLDDEALLDPDAPLPRKKFGPRAQAAIKKDDQYMWDSFHGLLPPPPPADDDENNRRGAKDFEGRSPEDSSEEKIPTRSLRRREKTVLPKKLPPKRVADGSRKTSLPLKNNRASSAPPPKAKPPPVPGAVLRPRVGGLTQSRTQSRLSTLNKKTKTKTTTTEPFQRGRPFK